MDTGCAIVTMNYPYHDLLTDGDLLTLYIGRIYLKVIYPDKQTFFIFYIHPLLKILPLLKIKSENTKIFFHPILVLI